jgi:2-dehydropantoate 2-reductase
MKVCIVGSGAMGSTIGGVLSEGGLEVHLFDKWAQHVDAINAHGLRIKEGSSERVVKVRATTDYRTVGTPDVLIVLVKSFYTREAIREASSIIDDHTVVISLQNGLGNEDTLIDALGRQRVVGGRTFAGGVLLGPGSVIAGRTGKVTYIGELDGASTERVRNIADQFTRAGWETAASTNIMGIMWEKLLINVATGAFCGITGLTFGALQEVKEIMECAVDAIAEGVAVAAAHGVKLSETNPDVILATAHAGMPYEFKASILQDLEKGARTEVDTINGSIVRLGKKVNVPTPVNRLLVAGIKGIELHHAKARAGGGRQA